MLLSSLLQPPKHPYFLTLISIARRRNEVFNQIIEEFNGRFFGLLGDVGQQNEVREIDAEFRQQAGHRALLEFKLGVFVGQSKHTQPTRVPVPTRADDVREKEGQTSVVIKPPNVNNCFFPLLHREAGKFVDDFLGQFRPAWSAVQ